MRVEIDLGEPLEEGCVPFRGETLESFLCAHLQPGPCPDPRPVDAASMRPLPTEDFVVVARCGAWRNARIAREFDARFGPGVWRTGYSWGEHTLDATTDRARPDR